MEPHLPAGDRFPLPLYATLTGATGQSALAWVSGCWELSGGRTLLPTTESIASWAARSNAFTEFPYALSALILASCPDVGHIEMPGGKGVSCGGPDGHVECANGNAFVPAGSSLRELTTQERGITAKANVDYKKRKKGVAPAIRAKTAFVFATPRRWPGAVKWSDAKAALSDWKEVKAITADQLAMWVGTVPWKAGLFGTPDLYSLWDVWVDYRAMAGNVDLSAKFVVAGRSQQANEVRRWHADVRSAKRKLKIYGASEQEIGHFIAACVSGVSKPLLRETLWHTTIVMRKDDSAVNLGGINSKHTVIASEGRTIPAANRLAKEYGCGVIICCTSKVPVALPTGRDFDTLALPRPDNKKVIELVVGQGYDAAQAAKVCKDSEFDYAKLCRRILSC
jgi:hypothetical protein